MESSQSEALMRIAVNFALEKDLLLPWSYIDWLRGLLYGAMDRGIPQIAQLVHDQGFLAGGKQYKLIVFSLLHPQRYETTSQGLRVAGGLRWEVSSPLEPLIEAVTLGLLSEPEARLGKERVYIAQVRVLPPPPFKHQMIFTTLSPICVSTGERDEHGKFQKRFLSPDDPDFGRVLNENLKRKAEVVSGTAVAGDVTFTRLGQPRSKLLTVNDTQIRGWLMTFRVEGPAELLRVGYEAGFGERNAQGFGMVRVDRGNREKKDG
jgi:CRISPR-associated endoribonuclease Cas6